MALTDILATVRGYVATGAGATVPVHNGVRLAKDESTFRTLFRDGTNSRLHGWMVTHRSSDEEMDGSDRLSLRTHEVVCIGVYAVDDATSGTSMTSEVEFRTVVEAVATQIRLNYRMTGTAGVQQARPPQTRVFEHRMFHRVLVHYAEIAFEVVERLSYQPA